MNNSVHKQRRVAVAAAGLLFFCAPHVVMAQEAADYSLEEERVLLDQEQHRDMDSYFTYATKAARERNAREAEWALRAMLKENPDLDRVKLELALALVPQGKLAEAKSLLEEVKAHEPPPAVVKNIDTLLASIDKLMAPHQISGGSSVGINYDTNANSAPASGNITLLDTSIPLGTGAMSKKDTQTFGAVNVSHVYRHDIDPNTETLRWKTDFLAYGTKQDELNALDLQLYSLRSGPEITFLDSGIRAGLFANYSTIKLDGNNYLDDPKLEATVDIPLSTSVVLNLNGSGEYRQYHNAPTVTTYEDRNGASTQLGAGMRYTLDDQWLLNAGLYVRHEDAKADYFTNDQYSVGGGATYLVTPDTFITAQTSYHPTFYNAPDPLISVKTREDDEYTASLSVGHSFELPGYGSRLILSLGYQYRDVESNIQNNAYDNHRVMSSISVTF